MIPHIIRSLFAIALYFVLSGATEGAGLRVAPENGSGIYQPGRNRRLEHRQVDGANSSNVSEAAYILKQDGLAELAKGGLFSEGKGQIETKAEKPGWLLVEVTGKTDRGTPIKALGGAIVAPEKSHPTQPRPEDFDGFWRAKVGSSPPSP